MKRFFSKKSGFTLAEIIVAFAVFSIMAVLLIRVLNLTVNQRTQNQKFERYLQEQEKMLLTKEKVQKFDETETEDGIFKLKFKDNEGNLIEFENDDGDTAYEVRYRMVAADNNNEYDADGNITASSGLGDASGLNYFVSDKDPLSGNDDLISGGAGDDDFDEAAAGGSSQMSRYDTRLTGTRGINKITIRLVSGPTEDGNGGYTYEFAVTVYDSGVDRRATTHSQVSLFFGEGTSKEVDALAVVKSVEDNKKDEGKVVYVKKCGEHGVNLHCEDSTNGFNGNEKTFKVTFTEPLPDNLGFGDNGSGSLSSGITYTAYGGTTNIFGAYPKATAAAES